MTENEEIAKLVASIERFAEGNEARRAEYKSVEQEIALLTEQINTKPDHLRQLSEQRDGLITKCQSIRNEGQGAAMKYMTGWIAMAASRGV